MSGADKFGSVTSPADDIDLPSVDFVNYRPGGDAGSERPMLFRHLHCAFAEEAIRTWDQGAAERLIRKLELEVVKASIYGGDPRKPSLISWQGFEINNDWECFFRRMIELP